MLFQRQPTKVFINSEHRSEKTVHEHRAPTDDSVRLLKEMEKATLDSIFFTIKCDANTFKYSAIVYMDHSRCKNIVRVAFTLGEQHHDLTLELEDAFRGAPSREEVIKAIHTALSEKIAAVLTISCTTDMLGRVRI